MTHDDSGIWWIMTYNGSRYVMCRDIKWCCVFYSVHALICRQSPKLGYASDSGLGGGSLPARHNESLAGIYCPLHMNTWLPVYCHQESTPTTLRAVLPNTIIHHAPQNKVRCDGSKIKKLQPGSFRIILWYCLAWRTSWRFLVVQVFALIQKMLLSERLREFSIFLYRF